MPRPARSVPTNYKIGILSLGLSAATFLLGVVGWWKIDYNHSPHSVLVVLFKALGGSKSGSGGQADHNLWTDAASITGLVSLYSWFVVLFWGFLRDLVGRLVVRLFYRDHVVVIGAAPFARRAAGVWRARLRRPLQLVAHDDDAAHARGRYASELDDRLVDAFAGAAKVMTSLELLCLAAVTALAVVERSRAWQDRWIAARLLAELCATQEAMAALGGSLASREPHAADAPARRAVWTFDALVRASPLATGRLAPMLPRDVIRTKLAAARGDDRRDGGWRGASARLRPSIGDAVAVLAAVAICLAELARPAPEAVPHVPRLLGIAAAILPAASAAVFGCRVVLERARLARRAARRIEIAADADRRLASLRLDRPLASQDLASEVLALSAALRRADGHVTPDAREAAEASR